ncbi:MAG: hypothetical protein IK088_08600 [Lachnospiraceae bacterium]|nr:hypothetical protein [Lachnospiraceae bacterium]
MSVAPIIHNASLEYRPGTPYAVYTYSIADFDYDKAPLILLYTAFLKRRKNYGRPGVEKGEKKVKYYRPDKEKKKTIDEIVNEEDRIYSLIHPKGIFEGTDLSTLLFPGHSGYNGVYPARFRLKDHMPIEFDEEDIVFQIARYDSVYCPVLDEPDITDKERKKILAKMTLLRDTERANFKKRDYYKSMYASLGNLIDHWLDGKILTKDINDLLKKDDLLLAKNDRDLSVFREIDL